MLDVSNRTNSVIADDVTEDVNNGGQLHKKITGQKYTDVILRKSDQLKTFAIMRKTLKLKDGVEVPHVLEGSVPKIIGQVSRFFTGMNDTVR